MAGKETGPWPTTAPPWIRHWLQLFLDRSTPRLGLGITDWFDILTLTDRNPMDFHDTTLATRGRQPAKPSWVARLIDPT